MVISQNSLVVWQRKYNSEFLNIQLFFLKNLWNHIGEGTSSEFERSIDIPLETEWERPRNRMNNQSEIEEKGYGGNYEYFLKTKLYNTCWRDRGNEAGEARKM